MTALFTRERFFNLMDILKTQTDEENELSVTGLIEQGTGMN